MCNGVGCGGAVNAQRTTWERSATPRPMQTATAVYSWRPKSASMEIGIAQLE
jgi:hypothetical protein